MIGGMLAAHAGHMMTGNMPITASSGIVMRKETLVLLFSFSIVLLIIGGMLEAGVAQQRAAVITTRYADCRELASPLGLQSAEGCKVEVKDYTKNGDFLVYLDSNGQQGILPAKSVKAITPKPPLAFDPFRNIYLLTGLLLLAASLFLAWRRRTAQS